MDSQLTDLRSLLSGGGTQTMGAIGIAPFFVLLAAALACSLFVSYLYVHFLGRRATGHGLHRAFPLLGLTIAALFITVQFSLPLSLGLLGALTLVRFRSPVKEPEEIGFVMLVIAAAVATATFRLASAGVLLLAAVAALAWQGRSHAAPLSADGMLTLSIPAPNDRGDLAAAADLIERALPGRLHLSSLRYAPGSLVLAYAFRGIDAQATREVETAIRRTLPRATLAVCLNRPEPE